MARNPNRWRLSSLQSLPDDRPFALFGAAAVHLLNEMGNAQPRVGAEFVKVCFCRSSASVFPLPCQPVLPPHVSFVRVLRHILHFSLRTRSV